MTRDVQEPVNVAAIGLGRWSRILANQYTQLDNINLVTCFTRTEETRESFASDFDCDAERSLEDLLARDDVEGVIVTVPNDSHADVVEQAAEAGKHCYLEKAIADNMADALRIRDAVESSDIVFGVAHSFRHVGGLRKSKEMIESGELGDVSFIEAEACNERGLELGPDNWRSDPKRAPGGPLIQVGIHMIDNLQYLLGPIEEVFTYGKPMYTEANNFTMTHSIMRFEDGRQAYLGANWTAPGTFFNNVYGTDGVLFYEMDFSNWSNSEDTDEHSTLVKREFEEWTEDKDERKLRDVDVDMPQTNHLRDPIEEFATAVRNEDVEPEVGAEEAIRNLAVVLAGQRSANEQRPVTVQEVIDGT